VRGDPGVPDDDGDGDVEDGEVGCGPARFGVSGSETEHKGSTSHSSTAGGDRSCALRPLTGGGGCSPRAGGAGSDGCGADADSDDASPGVDGTAPVGGGAYDGGT